MNKENNWDHMIVTHEEIMIVIKPIKPGKTFEPSKLCAEITSASGEVGTRVIMELCQCVLDGKGMPDNCKTSVLVPTFKEKGDVRNCNIYREVMMLERAMKIVERVLERRIRK